MVIIGRYRSLTLSLLAPIGFFQGGMSRVARRFLSESTIE